MGMVETLARNPLPDFEAKHSQWVIHSGGLKKGTKGIGAVREAPMSSDIAVNRFNEHVSCPSSSYMHKHVKVNPNSMIGEGTRASLFKALELLTAGPTGDFF
jgi:hypothetical protein